VCVCVCVCVCVRVCARARHFHPYGFLLFDNHRVSHSRFVGNCCDKTLVHTAFVRMLMHFLSTEVRTPASSHLLITVTELKWAYKLYFVLSTWSYITLLKIISAKFLTVQHDISKCVNFISTTPDIFVKRCLSKNGPFMFITLPHPTLGPSFIRFFPTTEVRIVIRAISS
jgi:hypothetical protein